MTSPVQSLHGNWAGQWEDVESAFERLQENNPEAKAALDQLHRLTERICTTAPQSFEEVADMLDHIPKALSTHFLGREQVGAALTLCTAFIREHNPGPPAMEFALEVMRGLVEQLDAMDND